MISDTHTDAPDVLEEPDETASQGGVKEFLAFSVGQEEYGVDIRFVQEIRSYERPTAMALAPADYKGVIQLRGVIVPVIDLRLRLGAALAPYNELTMVIVLRIGNHLMGAVVDRVSDVLMLHPHHLRPVPAVGADYATDFITALGSLDGRTISLLNIESLMLRNKNVNLALQVNDN